MTALDESGGCPGSYELLCGSLLLGLGHNGTAQEKRCLGEIRRHDERTRQELCP
jgi:hypothetical protein